MKYFAYGSNMSLARLQQRVPSAEALGCYRLKQHDLRFHKASIDGSGKCDAYQTQNEDDLIYGVLFEIDPKEKADLDKAEGLGKGYEIKTVEVVGKNGASIQAFTYFATRIEQALKPYSWYVNHVVIGAKQALLPEQYIEQKILSMATIEDLDKQRDARQRQIHA